MPTSILLQKIKFYKNLLYVFYFFCIVSLVCSFTISISYFIKTGEIYTELVVSVLGIIIFGVILPYLVIKKIQHRIHEMQKQIEKQVQTWVKGWFETYAEYGSESFQNSEFWLKIVMLSLEQLAQYSTHPAIYMASEVSKIVRTEMEHQKINHAKYSRK